MDEFEHSPEYAQAIAAIRRAEKRIMKQARSDFNERLQTARAKDYSVREQETLKKFRADSAATRPSFFHWLFTGSWS